jgi:2-oxoglutarate ferredoxin oxidoreductase subunit alpha
MEPVDFSAAPKPQPTDKSSWAATGAKGRKPHLIKTLYLDPEGSEKLNQKLAAKYVEMKKKEVRFEKYNLEKNRELVIVAFGTTARVCKTAIDELKTQGIEVGLFRPISLFPFPIEPIRSLAKRPAVKKFLTIEMNTGQMLEDVELAVLGNKPVSFYGRQGGNVPSPEEIIEQCKKHMKH